MSTKIYSIYAKPEENLEKAETVKEGFSWFAFLLPFIWSLYRRIWWFAAVIFLLNAGLAIAAEENVIVPAMSIVIQFAIMLIAGFSAGDLIEKKLSGCGYELRDIIVARDDLGARFKFFRRELKSC